LEHGIPVKDEGTIWLRLSKAVSDLYWSIKTRRDRRRLEDFLRSPAGEARRERPSESFSFQEQPNPSLRSGGGIICRLHRIGDDFEMEREFAQRLLDGLQGKRRAVVLFETTTGIYTQANFKWHKNDGFTLKIHGTMTWYPDQRICEMLVQEHRVEVFFFVDERLKLRLERIPQLMDLTGLFALLFTAPQSTASLSAAGKMEREFKNRVFSPEARERLMAEALPKYGGDRAAALKRVLNDLGYDQGRHF
jgi:hypothetical protein